MIACIKKPFFYTIALPVALFIFILIADRPFPDFMPNLTQKEKGLVEISQEIILILAFTMGVFMLWQGRISIPHWLKIWVGLGACGALYIFLEEISYGQQYLQWNTPEYWAKINKQQETNLHNTSGWFNQKPRTLLEIGIILGGIIAPLLYWLRPATLAKLPEKIKTVLPDPALFTIALLAVLPRVYERIVLAFDKDDWLLFLRTSEVQELYFYYFILIYLIFLHKKLRARA